MSTNSRDQLFLFWMSHSENVPTQSDWITNGSRTARAWSVVSECTDAWDKLWTFQCRNQQSAVHAKESISPMQNQPELLNDAAEENEGGKKTKRRKRYQAKESEDEDGQHNSWNPNCVFFRCLCLLKKPPTCGLIKKTADTAFEWTQTSKMWLLE